MFWGGSLTAKSGCNDRSTCKANCEGERLVEIVKILRRIDSSRCGSFICNRIKPRPRSRIGDRERCSTKWKHTRSGRSERCRTRTRGGQVQVA